MEKRKVEEKHYRVYTIRDEKTEVSDVAGTAECMADFLKNCTPSSIVIMNSQEGELFLVAFSEVFLFCEDESFLNQELIPLLRKS